MDGQAMVEIEQAVLCIYNQALDRNTRQNANLFLDQALPMIHHGFNNVLLNIPM
jgi:hypothetical protein